MRIDLRHAVGVRLVRGRCLPESGRDQRGDVLLRIAVHILQKLSAGGRKRFAELQESFSRKS